MTFLDVEGLHDEDMLVYDDGEEEGEPRDGEEDMMPQYDAISRYICQYFN